MTRSEAAALVTQLLGSFPSPKIHDPEVYMTGLVTLLSGYPLWAGQATIATLARTSKWPPAHAEVCVLLEEQVRVPKYVAEWDAGARRLAQSDVLRIEGPPVPKLSYAELKSKYGKDWGIAQKTIAAWSPPTLADICAQAGVDPDSIPDNPAARMENAEQLGRSADREFKKFFDQAEAAE